MCALSTQILYCGLQVFDLDGSSLLDFDFTNLNSHSLPALDMPAAQFHGSLSDGEPNAELSHAAP